MNTGELYIVATPLGNLKDITLRAIETLKSVDYIAAEDTRHSKGLLQHYAIETPMIALHDHNERKITDKILHSLQQGKSIALITDAGTPLISDPGFYLARTARQQGIRVIPIPGPCAAIAALSASGLPTDRFLFEGFLPVKQKARQERLERIKNLTCTLVFYEAPHRILDLIKSVEIVFGKERQAVLARELTKIYETIYAGTLSEILTFIETNPKQQLGEMVLMVEGALQTDASPDVSREILSILLTQVPLKQAVEIASKLTHLNKNKLYDMALELKGKD